MSIGHPVTDETTGRITGLAPGVECDNEAGFRFENFEKLGTRWVIAPSSELNSKTYQSNVPE